MAATYSATSGVAGGKNLTGNFKVFILRVNIDILHGREVFDIKNGLTPFEIRSKAV